MELARSCCSVACCCPGCCCWLAPPAAGRGTQPQRVWAAARAGARPCTTRVPAPRTPTTRSLHTHQGPGLGLMQLWQRTARLPASRTGPRAGAGEAERPAHAWGAGGVAAARTPPRRSPDAAGAAAHLAQRQRDRHLQLELLVALVLRLLRVHAGCCCWLLLQHSAGAAAAPNTVGKQGGGGVAATVPTARASRACRRMEEVRACAVLCCGASSSSSSRSAGPLGSDDAARPRARAKGTVGPAWGVPLRPPRPSARAPRARAAGLSRAHAGGRGHRRGGPGWPVHCPRPPPRGPAAARQGACCACACSVCVLRACCVCAVCTRAASGCAAVSGFGPERSSAVCVRSSSLGEHPELASSKACPHRCPHAQVLDSRPAPSTSKYGGAGAALLLALQCLVAPAARAAMGTGGRHAPGPKAALPFPPALPGFVCLQPNGMKAAAAISPALRASLLRLSLPEKAVLLHGEDGACVRLCVCACASCECSLQHGGCTCRCLKQPRPG